MDLSDYSEEVIISDRAIFDNTHSYAPRRPLVLSGIHRAIFEADLQTVKLLVRSEASINAGDVRYGFTPLHVAVMINNLELVDYLLSRDDISVNAKALNDASPLHLAADMGRIESVRRLVGARADVNLRDSKNNTPLHKAVRHPQIAHFLVQNGALVDAVNDWRETPLHHAAGARRLETVCMLLYHDAEVDVFDEYGDTPFVRALKSGDVESQRVLLDYVADFDDSYALKFALQTNSPLVGEMIESGAEVNYGDDEGVPESRSAFHCCLTRPVSGEIFKLVWDKITYNEQKNTVNFNSLFSRIEGNVLENYVRVMVESDNFEPAVDAFTANRNLGSFIATVKRKLGRERLTIFICRLLECGYRPTSFDVSSVFSIYGFCELMRILLYMDVDCAEGWPSGSIIPRMMFDLDGELEERQILSLSDQDSLALLRYFTYPSLFGMLVHRRGNEIDENRRDTPSLVELARNTVRQHVWNSLEVKTTCQFYTAIDNLPIPATVRKILTLERKLYDIRL